MNAAFWDGVDRSRRRRIARAVRQGRAVEDPTDAGIAVAFARRLQAMFGSRSRTRRLLRLALVGYLAVEAALAVYGKQTLVAVLAAGLGPFLMLLLELLGWWNTRNLPANAARAERLNEDIAIALAIDVPDWKEERRTIPLPWPLSKRPRGSEVLLVLSLVSLAGVGLLPSRGRPGGFAFAGFVAVAAVGIASAAAAMRLGVRRFRAGEGWRVRSSGLAEVATGFVLTSLWIVIAVAGVAGDLASAAASH